jgi:hypothetical protein
MWNCTKDIETLYGQNLEFLNGKPVGAYSNHLVLNCSISYSETLTSRQNLTLIVSKFNSSQDLQKCAFGTSI